MYENTYWCVNTNILFLICKYIFVCAVFNTKIIPIPQHIQIQSIKISAFYFTKPKLKECEI